MRNEALTIRWHLILAHRTFTVSTPGGAPHGRGGRACPPPPAFACASDTLAVGVLHALAERGVRPGLEVGVVGFDDSLAAQVTWPGLTSVRQPLEQVAVELVGLLRAALDGVPTPASGTVLTPTLVVRSSSLRAASG